MIILTNHVDVIGLILICSSKCPNKCQILLYRHVYPYVCKSRNVHAVCTNIIWRESYILYTCAPMEQKSEITRKTNPSEFAQNLLIVKITCSRIATFKTQLSWQEISFVKTNTNPTYFKVPTDHNSKTLNIELILNTIESIPFWLCFFTPWILIPISYLQSF